MIVCSIGLNEKSALLHYTYQFVLYSVQFIGISRETLPVFSEIRIENKKKKNENCTVIISLQCILMKRSFSALNNTIERVSNVILYGS